MHAGASMTAPDLLNIQFRLLVEAIADYAIFLLDPDGIVLTWNAGAERMMAYSKDEIVGQHLSRFYVPEETEPGGPQALLETAALHGRAEDEGWRCRQDGSRFWAVESITALRDASGTLLGFGEVTRDMTARHAGEDRLRYLADHDALTGAYNRGRFEQELAREMAQARRYGRLSTLLVVDLDNFKPINDTLGHRAGDQVLKETATILQRRLRRTDIIARLGGDEFGALLLEVDSHAGEVLAQSVASAVEAHEFTLADVPIHITASVGAVSIDPEAHQTLPEIFSAADAAMYAAKTAGGGQAALAADGDSRLSGTA
jgi:diguanylate cyclase (GGDEF)-like protein/PAS domain S-box-containing protein